MSRIDHYENFPVASLLLPPKLRQPIVCIYHFAREADDFADEGNATNSERLAQLQAFSEDLDRIERGETPDIPTLQRLSESIRTHHLPLQPFRDLLSAFRQDVECSRYADFQTLMDYCRRSANPVGRLVLTLAGQQHPMQLQWSDAICSALQLINFLQDIAIDWEKSRVYLPLNELALFDLDESAIPTFAHGAPCTTQWARFMQFQTRRARELMLSGARLLPSLSGRLRWEIHLTMLGGLAILDKIDAAHGDVFRHRPVIKRTDWLRMLWQVVARKPLPARRASPIIRSCPKQ